jgi:hypothetical protein
MFKVKSKPVHKFIARIPELNQVLVRDTSTNRLELWTPSRGVELHAINLGGEPYEFVREVDSAYRVPHTDYNQKVAPHEIGRIYVDDRPIGLDLKEL